MKSNYFDAKELLHDLHRQFAENQNAAAELFIKLLIALLGLLGSLGYVYSRWEGNISSVATQNNDFVFTTNTLYMAIFVNQILLCLIAFLVIHFGASFRRDQLLNAKIRYESMGNSLYKYFFKEYGVNVESLPGLYGIFLNFVVVFQIALILFSVCLSFYEESYVNRMTVLNLLCVLLPVFECLYKKCRIGKLIRQKMRFDAYKKNKGVFA